MGTGPMQRVALPDMAEVRARLWQSVLLARLEEAGACDYELAEWMNELSAEEGAAQSDFRDVGLVFAQPSQVEAGLRELERCDT